MPGRGGNHPQYGVRARLKGRKRHIATDLGPGTIVILVPLARQSFTRSV